jgi:uncharacterized RDD family membrane protein YckC
MDDGRSNAESSHLEEPRPDRYWLRQPIMHGRVEYAGFWRRFFAGVIDSFILGILVRILESVFESFFDRMIGNVTTQAGFWTALAGWASLYICLYIVVYWIYHAGMESSRWRATLGKKALGVVVTDLAGDRISFGRASVRYFAQLVSVLTFMIGYLIQPFTQRRQALHDKIVGTLVVRARSLSAGANFLPAGSAEYTGGRPSGMPSWVKGALLGVATLFLGCIAVSAFVAVPRIRSFIEDGEDKVAEEISSLVSATVSMLILTEGEVTGQLELSGSDLDINNAIAFDSSGVEWGTDGTYIYGFETAIDASGITVGADGQTIFWGVPIVRDGELELTSVEGSFHLFGFVMTAVAIEHGLENGINDALAASGLRPTGVTLNNGSMVIHVEPATRDNASRWVESNG